MLFDLFSIHVFWWLFLDPHPTIRQSIIGAHTILRWRMYYEWKIFLKKAPLLHVWTQPPSIFSSIQVLWRLRLLGSRRPFSTSNCCGDQPIKLVVTFHSQSSKCSGTSNNMLQSYFFLLATDNYVSIDKLIEVTWFTQLIGDCFLLHSTRNKKWT